MTERSEGMLRVKPSRTHHEGRRTGGRRRARSPWWARTLVVVGTVLMATSGATVVGGKLFVAHYSKGITHKGGLGSAAAVPEPDGKAIDGAINLLFAGIDERPGDNGSRADSIIIAHIPATHDAVYLASIPRDTRAKIPARPQTGYAGGTEKINHAFQYGSRNGGGRDGGLELLAETVSDLAGGLKFHGAAIINFDGFKDLVKAIGGVRMYVDEKVTSIHIGENIYTGKVGVPYYINPDGRPAGLKPGMRAKTYEVGWHDFADWEALDYVRQRDLLASGESDYGRQRHQQQFIKAVADKVTSTGVVTNPLKVNAVLKSLGKAVSFYNNGIDMADWIFTLKDISPDKMVMIKTNGGKFNSVQIGNLEYEELSPDSHQLLDAIRTEDVGSFVAEHPSWVTTGNSG